MRILFVQISDIHCKETDSIYSLKIEKAVDALRELGKIDGAALVFSGDLADKATRNEYAVGRKIIGKILSQIGSTFSCGFIPTLIVPGNHDISLPEGCREIDTILSWNRADHLEEELKRCENFLSYARSKNCFLENGLVDIRTVSISNVNVQFCLLNSAPFSTKKKDNKEVHYFPSEVEEKMRKESSADLKITVVHHSYSWCDWETQQMLKRSFSTDDIVFFGHDHLSEAYTIQNASGDHINIIKGGEFTLDLNSACTFNAVIFDSEKHKLEMYEYNWEREPGMFVQSRLGEVCPHHDAETLTPTQAYLDKLLADKQKIAEKVSDYYVLPKLIAEGCAFSEYSEEQIGLDGIFGALDKEHVIGISGGAGSGKSTLLKYLYYASIERGYLPLFIEKKGYDTKFEKMFRSLFEQQYGDVPFGFEKYMQADFNKRIVFIDDIDLIRNAKARANLVAYVTEHGGSLIYSTKEKYQQDLTETVKDQLQGKSYNSLDITPFYKEVREELVRNICALEQYSGQDPQVIIASLDYMAQCQADFLVLTPGNIVQYIKYFLQEGTIENRDERTINLVFETNIRHAIMENANGQNPNIILAALEYIAYEMYFKLGSEILPHSNFETLIQDFIRKRRANVNFKVFRSTCIQAGVFTEVEDSFDVTFTSKNAFAYFVAKYVNRALEKDPTNQEDIMYIMRHICFGINDIIVLFLSYIRGNSRIIVNIAMKAWDLLETYPELDFDQNNLPFLRQTELPVNTIPSDKDRKQNIKQTENIEKERQTAVNFRSIFDFDEEDVEKDRYRVLRALKYTRLIGRAFVDQYGDLDEEEIEIMVRTLYHLPQKIAYAILHQYQEHYTNIVNQLTDFVKTAIPGKEITPEEIKELLSQAAVSLTLNLMNDIAYNASSSSSLQALTEFKAENSNHKLQKIMMLENAGGTDRFIDNVVKIRLECSNDGFVCALLSVIAQKHLLNLHEVDHRYVDRLVSGKVLLPNGRKQLLLDQHKQEKG